MEKIVVMPKPDWISWEDIHQLLLSAHKKNIDKGIVMGTSQLSGPELEKRVGEVGRCFVALADDILVGTTSVGFFKGRSWYDKNQLVAHSMLAGILPRYQGIGIVDELNAMRDAYIHEVGATIIQADTAEGNTIVRKNAKRNGYREVEYRAFKSGHYSVIFVKWLNGCPFSDRFIHRRYKLSERLTKIQYKPGRIERSRVLSLFCNAIRKVILIH